MAREHSKWFLDFQPPLAHLETDEICGRDQQWGWEIEEFGQVMKKARESELAYDTNDLEDLGEVEFSGSNLCVTYQQFQ